MSTVSSEPRHPGSPGWIRREAQNPALRLQSGIIGRLIERLRLARLTEGQVFLLLAILIGLFSGMLVVCFQIAIDWTRLWLLGSSLAPSHWRLLLVPSLAGIGVSVLVMRVFHKVRGSGVNQTKAAVYIFDGYV